MQARTAPTSPAAKKNVETVTKVWTDGAIQQPPKTPWGRIILLVLLVTLIFDVATIAAFGWYVHRYPQSWLARFAPLTSTTTTTVVQPPKETAAVTAPAAVQRLLASAYGLARNQGQNGVYRSSDVLGLAWPLSGSGWTVSVNGAWPTDVKSLMLIPTVGQTQAVVSTITDPGTQFIFLKSTAISAQPISLGSAEAIVAGASVWVIDGQSAVPQRITQLVEPRWAASDRDETYFKLETSLAMPVGAAVVTADGQIIGLLGIENRVWPIPAIESVVKQVIQQAIVSRPVLGIRALNQATARITGQPTASGFLIGADDGDTAVVAKGPADQAGLKSGDVITALNGQLPTGTIFSALAAYQAGDKISLTFSRQTKEKTVNITLGSTRP